MKIEKKNAVDMLIAVGLIVNILTILTILIFYFSK